MRCSQAFQAAMDTPNSPVFGLSGQTGSLQTGNGPKIKPWCAQQGDIMDVVGTKSARTIKGGEKWES